MKSCTIDFYKKRKLFKENAIKQAEQFEIDKVIPEYEELYNRFL